MKPGEHKAQITDVHVDESGLTVDLKADTGEKITFTQHLQADSGEVAVTIPSVTLKVTFESDSSGLNTIVMNRTDTTLLLRSDLTGQEKKIEGERAQRIARMVLALALECALASGETLG